MAGRPPSAGAIDCGQSQVLPACLPACLARLGQTTVMTHSQSATTLTTCMASIIYDYCHLLLHVDAFLWQ